MTGPSADPPEPTALDRENERRRREIADRQAEEYGQVLRWALGAFGPGWLPSGRHYLAGKEEEDRARRAGDRTQAAATVYGVTNGVRKRYFTVVDGKANEVEGYEQGFGPMLLELHPTQGFTDQAGKWCRTHRYSLCWAGYELYEPKSAEQLAALRVSRERGKVGREEKRFAEDNPLLARAGIKAADLKDEDKGRGR
jgi:hypothetical protein